MAQTTFKYTLEIQGNDIDAKTAKSLKKGDSLSLKRIYDSMDTYEIVVYTSDDKELDMLGYAESVGIAPFLDDQRLCVVCATVDDVSVTEGSSHASDITYVNFSVVFEYDDTVLAPFGGGYNETMAFMPADDDVFCLCLYRLLDYNMPIITQTHLNRYEFEVDMDDDTKTFFDIDWDDEDYFFTTEILFDETFTKCRMTSRIYSETKNYPLPTTEKTACTLMTFVNHVRIFNDQEAITDCSIDL